MSRVKKTDMRIQLEVDQVDKIKTMLDNMDKAEEDISQANTYIVMENAKLVKYLHDNKLTEVFLRLDKSKLRRVLRQN